MKCTIRQIETDFGVYRRVGDNMLKVSVLEDGPTITLRIDTWLKLIEELPQVIYVESAKVEADSLSAMIREEKYGQEEQD